MKKLFFIALIFNSHFSIAQEFTSRVPESSFTVIHYSGNTLTSTIPISKLDQYGMIKQHFFEALRLDTAHSLSESGIDFSSDLLQYAVYRDKTLGFITLFSISNPEYFVRLVDANYGAELRPMKRDGYEIVYLSDQSTIAWNGNYGVFVYGNFMGKKRYNPYEYSTSDTALAIPEPDVADSVEALVPEIQEPDTTLASPEINDEEVPDTSVVTYQGVWDNNQYQQWNHEQDSIAKLRVRAFAESISSAHFKLEFPTAMELTGYRRVVNNNAAVSLWMNSNNIFQLYMAFAFNTTFMPYKNALDINASPAYTEDGLFTGTNFYFLKDKVHAESLTYSPSENLKKQMKALYGQKQKKSISGFINPDNLGYVSFSFNTETAIHSYYDQIKKYLSYYEYSRGYSDIINLYIDLMEIVIDEKGIADLFPGNYLMVLHGLSTRQVKYTDYEYDDNFEYKTIQKTKNQLSPDFSFVMDTRREDFMRKALDVPLKYAEKNNYDYQKHDDYYELKFPDGESVYSSLYFMVSGGRLVVTSNRDVIDKVMRGIPFNAGKEVANRIRDNVFAAHINLAGIMDEMKLQVSEESDKKIITYLSENLKSADAFTGYKKGELKGTLDVQMSNNFENSLMGIFEMIEKVNEIEDHAKQDAQNKLN